MSRNLTQINVETNSLGIAVSLPTQELIIMRGIPGAGKSTKAESLVGDGIIHSTDKLIDETGDYRAFFEAMKTSGNFAELSKMHAKNLANAKASMLHGTSPIVIDNTNLKANESKAYVVAALELGYADENIKIVDVGTGGLDAEGLFKRNTHGVPLDKIEAMIQSHASTGELTLEKILNSKDMFKPKQVKVLYSAVVLDEDARARLLSALADKIPAGWEVIGHHMTIIFGEELPENLKPMLGRNIKLSTTKLGLDDMAMAVQVEGFETLSGKPPHITIAINREGGAKPVMGGEIKKWVNIHDFILTGVVTEVKSS